MKFKIKDNSIILLIILMMLGSIATVQIRSIVNMQKQSEQELDLDKLKIQLDSRIRTGESYKKQIEELENSKEAFIKASSANNLNSVTKVELDYLRLISGLTDVTGDGVIITLNDASESGNAVDEDVTNYIIHDSDVLNVVNQLRVGGAQAIAINNERIIATSEQVCAGPTIKVNNNRYAVPFEIKAIGDPDLLLSTFQESGIFDQMTLLGKRITISKQTDIVIPKFSNDINSLVSKLEVVNNETKNK